MKRYPIAAPATKARMVNTPMSGSRGRPPKSGRRARPSRGRQQHSVPSPDSARDGRLPAAMLGAFQPAAPMRRRAGIDAMASQAAAPASDTARSAAQGASLVGRRIPVGGRRPGCARPRIHRTRAVRAGRDRALQALHARRRRAPARRSHVKLPRIDHAPPARHAAISAWPAGDAPSSGGTAADGAVRPPAAMPVRPHTPGGFLTGRHSGV